MKDKPHQFIKKLRLDQPSEKVRRFSILIMSATITLELYPVEANGVPTNLEFKNHFNRDKRMETPITQKN